MPRRRVSARTALGLLLAIALSAAITATITILLMRSNTTEQPGGQASSGSATSASAPATPQFSAAESAAAKSPPLSGFRYVSSRPAKPRGSPCRGQLELAANLAWDKQCVRSSERPRSCSATRNHRCGSQVHQRDAGSDDSGYEQHTYAGSQPANRRAKCRNG